jgi:hypothetical protein
VTCHRLGVFIGSTENRFGDFRQTKIGHHLYDIIDVHLAQVVFLVAITQHNELRNRKNRKLTGQLYRQRTNGIPGKQKIDMYLNRGGRRSYYVVSLSLLFRHQAMEREIA